jgi:predicted nuclease of predicted toxin-antitoxin system
VLLDECVPARLRRELPGFYVRAVKEYGWSGKENGELLRAAAGEFEVFVTIDNNLIHQQNLRGISLGIIVLHAYSNNIEALRPLIPELLPAMGRVEQARSFTWVRRSEAPPPRGRCVLLGNLAQFTRRGARRASTRGIGRGNFRRRATLIR